MTKEKDNERVFLEASANFADERMRLESELKMMEQDMLTYRSAWNNACRDIAKLLGQIARLKRKLKKAKNV